MLPSKGWGKGLSYYLSQDPAYIGAYISLWTRNERKKLLQPIIWQQIKDYPAEKYKEGIINNSETNDALFRLHELDMHTYMEGDILTKVDRASMMNSLEVRLPILDHKVAELSFRIPSRLKLHDRDKKYIFKKAISKYLNKELISRPKNGFSIPLSIWFKDSLKNYVHDRLLNPNHCLLNYIQMDFVAKIVTDLERGGRDMSAKIWSILFIDTWLEQNRNGGG